MSHLIKVERIFGNLLPSRQTGFGVRRLCTCVLKLQTRDINEVFAFSFADGVCYGFNDGNKEELENLNPDPLDFFP